MRPVPWLWIIRLVGIFGAILLWAAAYPHATSWWQLFLVGFTAGWLIDGMAWSYRYAQAKVITRRQQKWDRIDRGNR